MIGLNVLGFTVSDQVQLVEWVATARPPYTLVMDDLKLADRLATLGTQLVFRRYREGDDAYHVRIDPADFLMLHADVPTSYVLQALNEPGGDQAQLAEWCAALIKLADAVGRRLALPNWSVGNPSDEAVAAGGYDALWHAMARSGRHFLGVHEYFHDDPRTEPWHIGRFAAIVDRFVALGYKPPRVLVTEHGRDLGGGHDGWRTVFTEAEYIERLKWAQATYDRYQAVPLVFGFGSGFNNRWQTYNVEGAKEVLKAMADMNQTGPIGWKRAVTKKLGASVNVRSGPRLSALPIGALVTGQWAKPDGTTVKADGLTWQPVRLEDCRRGWCALEVISFV